MQMSKEEGTNR